MGRTKEEDFIHDLSNQFGSILTSIELLQMLIKDEKHLAILSRIETVLGKSIKLMRGYFDLE